MVGDLFDPGGTLRLPDDADITVRSTQGAVSAIIRAAFPSRL